jgi:hypothetical protein
MDLMEPGRGKNEERVLSAHIGLVIPLHACLVAVLPSEWLGSGLSVSFFLAHLGRLLNMFFRGSPCLTLSFASVAQLRLVRIEASDNVGRTTAKLTPVLPALARGQCCRRN